MNNRIRELRGEMGLTQQQLAERVDVSSRTIISLEKGQYNPSVLLAHKLALVFGYTIEEVFIFGEEDGI
jgi:putative transcriptional regulator